ncbi:acyltransferase family protein, partial [Bradyrhizobium sp. NBAIM08]|uniref:acyltransferase family protein n=1 Tax=Bradyrhizobium sp. NBAIM08 TaxID=2793815 RepID=UPI0034D38363|nr:acyltransferase [Bradyrhizobium sp. NBAIM08]
MQYLGDISYSVYLWHWPMIIIAPFALGETVFWPVKVLMVGITIVLAGLTKTYVEDRLRGKRGLVRTLPRTYAMGAACIAVVLAFSGAIAVQQRYAEGQEAERVVAAASGDC